MRVWGESIRYVLKKDGIGVSVICPGFVVSRMTANAPFPMPFLMSAARASAIIRRGLERNQARIAFPIGPRPPCGSARPCPVAGRRACSAPKPADRSLHLVGQQRRRAALLLAVLQQGRAAARGIGRDRPSSRLSCSGLERSNLQ